MNAININYKAKHLSFNLKYTKKNAAILLFLKSINLLSGFALVRKNKNLYFLIKLLYYKTLRILKNFKFFTKKTQTFFISLKALKLINKRCGTSFFLLSTSRGLITHKKAIEIGASGIIVGSFFN